MKRSPRNFFLFLILAFGISLSSKANALTISGYSVNQGAGTVTFNLAWDNSWFDGNNWDAAWIFVKFRACDSAGLIFQHALISTTLGDHTLGSFQATCASGTLNCIDANPNNTGVMLRRNSAGYGTVSSSVTLKLTNLPLSGALDVRVYGIEMVYIPQGAFILGDGVAGASSNYSFTTGPNNHTAIPVPSEGLLSTHTSPTSVNNFLTAAFPKGYNAFYIMKYEISQGQYADFLNGCSAGQSGFRYPAFNGFTRYQLLNTGSYPQNFYSTRPDRACNYLGWADLAGYLDWAALRPLTELQYEKAARGGGGLVTGECAWGGVTWTQATTISGPENGTEVISNANANLVFGGAFFAGGDLGTGPVRCGIFATPATTTRLQTGASYWGVMELSGNIYEYYISAYAGVAAAVSSTGVTLGDGYLNASGDHDVSNWPVNLVPGNTIIWRGGGFNTPNSCVTVGAPTCSVSNRYYYATSAYIRTSANGGRGGR